MGRNDAYRDEAEMLPYALPQSIVLLLYNNVKYKVKYKVKNELSLKEH
jgi:hypothetical protein